MNLQAFNKITLGVLLLIGISAAHACPSEPGRFLINADNTIYDQKTNLIWQRCALGRVWNGHICAGTETTLPWAQAVQIPENGTWRLPNIKELFSLVDPACVSPALSPKVFPGGSSQWFWSSTESGRNTQRAWHVHFYQGLVVDSTSKEQEGAIRLVRNKILNDE